jgi:hypothetical protein
MRSALALIAATAAAVLAAPEAACSGLELVYG